VLGSHRRRFRNSERPLSVDSAGDVLDL